jgi:glycosyltransferase involved in cell wall biosynthesis
MTAPELAHRPFLSVVVPVHGNAGTLHELHTRIVRTLEPGDLPYELIFVDDASPDDSASILADLAATAPRTRVVTMPRNVGQQWAVIEGLHASRGTWTAVMDADLQDCPESLRTLLDAASDKVDIVCAGRRGVFQSPGRMITSKAFKWLLHVVTGLPADAGIFMILRRRAVDRVLDLRTSRPHVLCLVGCTGLPAISLPVRRNRRNDGASAYSARARLAAGVRALACLADCKRHPRGPTVREQLERFGARA